MEKAQTTLIDEGEFLSDFTKIETKKKSKKKKTKSEKPFLETIEGVGLTTQESIALATRAQLTAISGIAEKTASLLIREARARFDLGLKKTTKEISSS